MTHRHNLRMGVKSLVQLRLSFESDDFKMTWLIRVKMYYVHDMKGTMQRV